MYVIRDLEGHFKALIKAIGIIAIVGPRQSGKTTFLRHMAIEQNAKYLTFDDPDVRDRFEDIKAFETEYISGNDITILDEVHYGSDPGIKLKYLADQGHKLWITSSTELLLGQSVLSHLVGRVSILRLYPFDLEEMLKARGLSDPPQTVRKRAIEEHMRYGGYPGIVIIEGNDVKVTLLRNLVETMLLKDVANTFSISDLGSLSRLTRILALNIGSSLAMDRLGQDLGLSFVTVKKYMDALMKSYLVFEVQPFFTNRNLEMKKQARYYFLDMGLRNAVINDFPSRPDGHAFENYVMSELFKTGLRPRYWRTKGGAEVDVVLEMGRELVPIEIKLNLRSMRVEKGMRSFIDRYSPSRAFIVGHEIEKETIREGGCTVSKVPLGDLLKELNEWKS